MKNAVERLLLASSYHTNQEKEQKHLARWLQEIADVPPSEDCLTKELG